MEEEPIIHSDNEEKMIPQNQEQQLTKRERKLLKKQQKLENLALKQKKQSQKRGLLWFFVSLLIVASVLGISWLSKYETNQGSLPLIDSISIDDHTKGLANAKNVLVEYSDFQCPACKQYNTLLKRASDEFGDKTQIVYRHFPLKSIHKNADLAARASEAASVQGKFWEMHDMLFDNQESWSTEGNPRNTFNIYAERMGIDIEQFKKDIDSNEVKDRVNKDYVSGINIGIAGTPTFFLNGKQINTPRSYDELRDILQ